MTKQEVLNKIIYTRRIITMEKEIIRIAAEKLHPSEVTKATCSYISDYFNECCEPADDFNKRVHDIIVRQYQATIARANIIISKSENEIADLQHILSRLNKQDKIKQYKKIPVVIDAIQWNGTNDCYMKISKFINNKDILHVEIDDHLYEAGVGVPYVDKMSIKTLEGEMLVSKGDYIIKGVNGEFYPCKPDVFKKTYEEVDL